MQLWNTYSREEMVERLREKNVKFVTISFYKYHHISDPEAFRNQLFISWNALEVLGRTYIAKEGINAQISVPTERLDAFRAALDEIDWLRGIRLNFAVEESAEFPFLKLKIKVRNKILADGLNDETFDVTNKGKHLNAEEFNKLTDDPNTILVDFRNHYESEVGHFKGAITPDVDTFRDSLPVIEEEILKGNEDKNIVMYCTGGIRCEKASAWFKHRGFQNVHQLEGGIIKYAHDVEKLGIENKFIGKNFVFDERRAEKISEHVIAQCHQCGSPFDVHTNCANEACHLLFIQCDSCKAKYDNCCSEECQTVNALPEETKKEMRKGLYNSNAIFKKGRSEKLKFKKNMGSSLESTTKITESC